MFSSPLPGAAEMKKRGGGLMAPGRQHTSLVNFIDPKLYTYLLQTKTVEKGKGVDQEAFPYN